jgi:hypothetical protein
MKTRISNRSRSVLAAAIASSVAAAYSGGGGGDSRAPTGALRIGITDAPVDEAASVVVEFSGVELKPRGGPAFSLDFQDPQNPGVPATREINLLAYQGDDRAILLDGEQVPAGEYEWMRLKVNAEPSVDDSYIELALGGGRCELIIPSGAQTGLKMIRGFTVAAGTTTDFTIDFDLRKSVVQPPGQQTGALTCDGQAYLLKPVLRVVDNLQVGSITGSVDPALVATACAATPDEAGRVYLYGPYAETDPIPAGVPDDVDGDPAGEDAADGSDPLDSAIVDPATGTYTFGFVQAGSKYVLAYTCDADDATVDADAADAPAGADEVVEFTPPDPDLPVTLGVGETRTVDFRTPAP